MDSKLNPELATELKQAIQHAIDGLSLSKEVGGFLRTAIQNRTSQLNDLGDRAIRMAIVMEACGRSGFYIFMHNKIAGSGWATERLAKLFGRHQAMGDLGGICSANWKGLTFEPAFAGFNRATEGKAYDIEFKQMALACGYLDFLHLTLGFEPMAALLAPVLRGDGGDVLDEVTTKLRKAVDDWFKGRAITEHYAGKSGAMNGYLLKLKNAQARFFKSNEGGTEVDMISIAFTEVDAEESPEFDGLASEDLGTFRVAGWHTRRWPAGYGRFLASGEETVSAEIAGGALRDIVADETIMMFWERIVAGKGKGAEDKGLILFQSASRAMIEYRHALDRSDADHMQREAGSLTAEDGTDLMIASAGDVSNVVAFDRWKAPLAVYQAEVNDGWESPLKELKSKDCSGVSWLVTTEMEYLSLVMADGVSDKTLFGKAKPETGFVLTILRALHFGLLQHVVNKKGALHKLHDPSHGDYASVVDKLEYLEKKILGAAYAAAASLIHRGHPFGVELLTMIEPDLAIEVSGLKPLSAMDDDELDEGVALRVNEITLAVKNPKSEVAHRMRTSYMNAARLGFRTKNGNNDLEDPSFLGPLVAGAGHIVPLHDEVASIVRSLPSPADVAHHFALDFPRFEGVLTELYGQNA